MATFRNDKGGFMLHARIVYQDKQTYPDHATITNARLADKTQMNELIVDETGALHTIPHAISETYQNISRLSHFRGFEFPVSKAI